MALAESTAAGKVTSRGPRDEESREWLRCLSGTGRDGRGTAEREQALARLHDLLLRAARAELRRRSRPAGVEGRERDDLAHQAAGDALLAITGKLDRFGADPAQHAESRELAGVLRRAVTEVLSDRQRRVFVAIIVDGVPLDALAAELGSTRNALYKTMFDARRKIRAHLVAHGYLDDEEPGTS